MAHDVTVEGVRLAFLDSDTDFGVLTRAAEGNEPFAGYLRDRYWHRLLTFDIPNEMRRKRTPEDRDVSIAAARHLVDIERAAQSLAEFNIKSSTMLRAIELGDRDMVEDVAELLK